MDVSRNSTCKLLVFHDAIEARKFNQEVGAGYDDTIGVNVAFNNLPFSVNPPNSASIPSNIRFIKDDYPVAFVAILRGLDWLIDPSNPATVINLSLGPGRDREFKPDDPLQIATRLISDMGIVVVVAAGNVSNGPEPDSLQALARAPWVISVGAVDFITGEILATSARGAPDKPCPTVVSYGLPKWTFIGNNLSDPGQATSFAAPRVANAAAFIYKALEIVLGSICDLLLDNWSTVTREIDFAVLGFADTAVHPDAITPPGEPVASALKRGEKSVRFTRDDTDKDWLLGVINFLKSHAIKIETNITPATVKNAVELAAKLYGGSFLHSTGDKYSTHTIFDFGSGFIDDRVATMFLGSLTPSHLLKVLIPDRISQLSNSDLDALDVRLGPLWTSEIVATLGTYFLDSQCAKHATVVQ